MFLFLSHVNPLLLILFTIFSKAETTLPFLSLIFSLMRNPFLFLILEHHPPHALPLNTLIQYLEHRFFCCQTSESSCTSRRKLAMPSSSLPVVYRVGRPTLLHTSALGRSPVPVSGTSTHGQQRASRFPGTPKIIGLP